MPASQKICKRIFFPDFLILPVALEKTPEVVAFLGVEKILSDSRYSETWGMVKLPYLNEKKFVLNPGSAVN